MTTPSENVAAGSSPSGELSQQLEQVTLSSGLRGAASKPGFWEVLEDKSSSSSMEAKDASCIVSSASQDVFCDPDHPTLESAQLASGFDADKENIPCPKSSEMSLVWSKSYKRGCYPEGGPRAPSGDHETTPVQFGPSQHDSEKEQMAQPILQEIGDYVPQSARVLRSSATPPPCIKNPYMMDPRIDEDIFCMRQCKSSGSSSTIGTDCLSRYRTDFHEIEQIGCGNFGAVFKVLRRIEGCLYAVKQIMKQLHNDNDMSLALREVQTLVAIGNHENIVGYFTSWFESEKFYIQMELCDRSLSMNENEPLKLGDALELLNQVCKVLEFLHKRGIAHLDVKPDNIFVRNDVYKLADFGCAALIDHSLAIEEGDTRYMPLEVMDGKIEHLDKVDIFSLGATLYELMRGSLLPKFGPEFTTLREGKIPLLPGWPMQLQSLIKSMMDPDPMRRPSAKEIMRHTIFEKLHNGPN